MFLNAGRCNFEWICLHFPKGLAARRKAIFRRLSGFERPENSPVDCMDASLDALRALQRERAGRPMPNGSAAPGAKSRKINAEMKAKTP